MVMTGGLASNLELGNVNMDDLITEKTMVVSISHRGYIKRIPSSTYKAQRRGSKGLKGPVKGRSNSAPLCS